MPSQGFDKDIMRIFNRIGVKPHILPTWVDDPTVISMVSHGLGVSMMTELTVRGRTDGVKLRRSSRRPRASLALPSARSTPRATACVTSSTHEARRRGNAALSRCKSHL